MLRPLSFILSHCFVHDLHHIVVNFLVSLSDYVMCCCHLSHQDLLQRQFESGNRGLTSQGMSTSLTEKMVAVAKALWHCMIFGKTDLLTTHLTCGAVGCEDDERTRRGSATKAADHSQAAAGAAHTGEHPSSH